MAQFKRREIIRNAALLGAGSLLAPHRSLSAVGADYDVVIIGAGMAGMTAARLLSRAGPGLKVLILEARGRVGGRMYTAPNPDRELPSHGVELGAQFIHGSKAATWELIREFGLEARPLSALGEPEYRFFSPGKPGNYAPDWDAVDALYERLFEAYESYQGPDISYQAFTQAQGFTPEEQEILASEPMSWTAEPRRISLQSALVDGQAWETWKDEDFQVVGGYGKLVDKMAKELTGKIQPNSIVNEVFWRQGIAGVSYKFRGSSAGLTTRRLVITVPIGVLQSGQILIQPTMPDWKLRAIDSMEMGQVVVAHMLFGDQFRREKLGGPGGWMTPGERIFFGIPHPPNQGGTAIQGWFAGSAAQRLSDLGPEAGMQQVLAWLQEASGFTDLQQKLKWHSFQDWIRDPYSLGSYSFTRPGGIGAQSQLARPVAGTLYFAGEATAPAPHHQTVHGAYMSGKRVAQEVASSLNVGDTGILMEDSPVITEEEEPIINPL